MGIIGLKRIKYIFFLACIVVVFFLFFRNGTKNLNIEKGTIAYKFAHSLEEIMPSDYYIRGDIAKDWRGYETFHGFQSYLDGSIFNLILGHGFGKLADMKTFMLLGSEKIRYIPILHNGYIFVLLKTGIVGLILYFLYIVKFIRLGLQASRMSDSRVLFAGRIIVGLGVVFLFTTYVICGMFNKSSLFSAMVLLGSMVGFLDKNEERNCDIEKI